MLRGERAFLILNRYPYNNGHFMAVPYSHVPSLEDLDAPTLTDMMLLLNRGLAALRHTMSPDGFNVGVNLGRVAGAGYATLYEISHKKSKICPNSALYRALCKKSDIKSENGYFQSTSQEISMT